MQAPASPGAYIGGGEGEGAVACEGAEREEGQGAPQIELEILLYKGNRRAKSPCDRKRTNFLTGESSLNMSKPKS